MYSISPVFTVFGFHSVGSLIMFLSNNGRVPFSFFLYTNMVTCSQWWYSFGLSVVECSFLCLIVENFVSDLLIVWGLVS